MDNKQYVTRLSRRAMLDYKETSSLLRSVSDSITDCLKEGDSVAIPGFGTFSTVKEDEHIEEDFSTGRRLLFPPSITLNFKPSNSLTKRLRQ